MRCPSDGEWRAELDGTVDAAQAEAMRQHRQACLRCQQRCERLAANARVALALAAPGPAAFGDGDATATLAAVLARVHRPVPPPPRRDWLWAPAAAVVILLALAILPQARSWAANVLSVLRIHQVTVVAVNPPELSPASERQVGVLLRQMIAQRVTVTIPAVPPRLAASGAEASQWAGFAVRLPLGVPAPAQIAVLGQQAFQMTLDAQRLDSVLAAAGRPDLQIPPADTGALVAVNIPASVRAAYGTCGAQPRAVAGCTLLRELPSPIISVPPSLNLETLAQIGLQAAGMSADEAAAFCRTVNWRSTLVLPIPEAQSTYTQIPVDGVQGILVRFAPRGRWPRSYALSWVRDGVIFSVRGQGPAAAGVALAQAMP
ncbi:MAG: hypothetical protein ACRD2E_00240 [Terriglobales bacterium]